MFKRTEGISTTDILGRILDVQLDQKVDSNVAIGHDDDDKAVQFMNVASQLEAFMHLVTPREGQKIVYVCGSFDLIHPGHVEFLKQARALGDYLIVGVQSDEVVCLKISDL